MILKSIPFAFFIGIASTCASDTLDGFPTEEPVNSRKREAHQTDLEAAREENERLTKQIKSLKIHTKTLQNMNAVLETTKDSLQTQLLALMEKQRKINDILNPSSNSDIVEECAPTYQRQLWRNEENLLARQLFNKNN